MIDCLLIVCVLDYYANFSRAKILFFVDFASKSPKNYTLGMNFNVFLDFNLKKKQLKSQLLFCYGANRLFDYDFLGQSLTVAPDGYKIQSG